MVMNHMSVQLSRQFPVDPLTCHKLTLNVCNNFLAMDLLGRAARPRVTYLYITPRFWGKWWSNGLVPLLATTLNG